jgi:hypothetical protein
MVPLRPARRRSRIGFKLDDALAQVSTENDRSGDWILEVLLSWCNDAGRWADPFETSDDLAFIAQFGSAVEPARC